MPQYGRMPQITRARPGSGRRVRLARPRQPLLAAAARPAAAAVAGGCVVVTVVLGILTAHQTHANGFDQGIDRWLQSALSGHVVLLDGLADCGAPAEVAVTAAVVLVACLCARWLRGALLVAAAVAAGGLAEYALKPLFGRTLYGALSYPSGHTIGAFCLAVTFAVLLTGPGHPPLPGAARWSLAAVALLVACGVAVSQVARAKHYFTDTVGGAAVAIALVLIIALVIDPLGEWLTARLAAGRQPAAP
jgi:membrane-associated phospholipid phosphatase